MFSYLSYVRSPSFFFGSVFVGVICSYMIAVFFERGYYSDIQGCMYSVLFGFGFWVFFRIVSITDPYIVKVLSVIVGMVGFFEIFFR